MRPEGSAKRGILSILIFAIFVKMRKRESKLLFYLKAEDTKCMCSPRNIHLESGTTLTEVLIAVLLFAIFFMSIFELNAVCLRYIDAGKESIAALELVHDRFEVLRNLAFTDLTNTTYLQGLLSSPANGSDFAKKATEVVRVSQYPVPLGVTQLTRKGDGTVTTNSTAVDLGTNLVQVAVTDTWNMTFGGRTRSAQITTIISNGTKK
jgi:Tfp pilus assembly protein PilV